MKKLFALLTAAVLVLSVTAASACTSLYVGSALTENGNTIFGRSEDISNSYNKTMHVVETGAHKAGDVYQGCYGFSWTFTHDTYGFTCFSDDNGDAVGNVCPDCGQTHEHLPYGAGGTNEKGVSMSATETIGGCDAVSDADPNPEEGIEEAEMIAVILSEADTAADGVKLMASIYDTTGACGGSGIFIADANETWYMENVTGHQYVAVKLTSGMVMSEPNMVVIGLVDLDDTDNVIASAGLISVAETAGTYVGDKEANTIDYRASYAPDQQANTRMNDALNFFSAASTYSDENPADASVYTVSNVAEDGTVTAMHTGITLDRTFSMTDAVNYYHISSIGYVRNLETHVFEVTPGDTSATGTVEWVAMNDACWSLFVPYLPMLTTSYADCVTLSTAEAEFVTEQPADDVLCYATTKRQWVDGERVSVDGWMIFPEGWENSMYWAVDVLSNRIETGDMTEESVTGVRDGLAEVQTSLLDSVYGEDGLIAAVKAAGDPAETATTLSSTLQNLAYVTVLAFCTAE